MAPTDVKTVASTGSDENSLSEAAQLIDEKKLMRKVDWHLIPWLCLLYLASFLDVSTTRKPIFLAFR